MTDLPPMAPCPYRESGRHELSAILPEQMDQDATLFCDRCGAVRRFPATGALYADRRDDLSASEIRRRVQGLRP